MSSAEPLAGFKPIPGTGGFPVVDAEAFTETPQHKIVKVTTETISSDSTLSDDAELKFIVKPFEVYMVTVYLVINSGTTPDFKHAWSVPAGTTGDHDTTAGSVPFASARTTAATGSDQTVNAFARFHVGGTGGTIALRWAQDTLTASDTKVLAGSFLIVRRMNA